MSLPVAAKKRVLTVVLLVVSVCAILCLPRDVSARAETLRWQQSDLTNVAGFKVYVGSTSGVYGPPIDVGMATLEGGDVYTYDLDVPDGVGVYVALAAYSASGLESGKSNERFLPGCATAAECSDGDACTGVELCVAGSCAAGTALDCSVPGPCETGFCDAQLGCLTEPVAEGVACDDGDAATIGDVCSVGMCVGVLPPPPECIVAADCSDGDACNGVEFCSEEICYAGAVLDCSIADPCAIGLCDAQLGCVSQSVPDGTSCDDGDAVTSGDVCQAGLCVGELPAPSECVADADCDDGNVCDGAERCEGGSCQSGVPLDCSAVGPCEIGLCDSQLGCVVELELDGTICYEDEFMTMVCEAGACVEPPPPPKLEGDPVNPCAPVFSRILPAILYLLDDLLDE